MSNKQELKMKFEWRIDPDKNLDAIELRRFEKTIALIGIDSGYVVDSYIMSAAGPVLESIFLFGGGFIVEINLSQKSLNFDLADITRAVNYRVKYSEHIQTVNAVVTDAQSGDPATKTIVTEFVQISIAHTDAVHSQLTYFGNDLNAWVDFCMKAYPPSSLLR